MKKLLYIPMICVAMLFAACEDSELPGIKLQELPGYVAFNAPGSNAFIPVEDVTVVEGSGIFEEYVVSGEDFRIECPTGNLDDITITLSFAGDAVPNTDYIWLTGTQITATGATVVLENTQQASVINHIDLQVDILDDVVVDGDKTLTVAIETASGDFAVGRGGTDLLRTVDIIITDND